MERRRWVLGVVVAVTVVSVAVGSGGEAIAGKAVGAGVGSKEALAQRNCDPNTGRIKFQFYGAAPCVRPWSDGDDNGGATAQGVTADSIKVVVLVPPADKDRASTNGGIKNQATGANGLSKDAVLDENAVLAHSYETWGRTIEYEFVEASGTDETAQRADAVGVIAKKPFMVLDTALYASGGGGLVFEQAVKAAACPSTRTLRRRPTCSSPTRRTWPSGRGRSWWGARPSSAATR